MSGIEMKNVVLLALVVLVVLFAVYQYDPTFFGLISQYDGFEDAKPSAETPVGHGATSGEDIMKANKKKEAFEDKKKEEEKKKEKFEDKKKEAFEDAKKQEEKKEKFEDKKKEGFADLSAYEGPANFASAEAPAGCYPRDQLTPSELLPKGAGVWSEQNPMGPGSLAGKNFLQAGALLGVNTVGQSLRNANKQLRSEPPNPQVSVSVFNQSTITPDISHRPLEIGA
jgi:hypothetical protein